MPLDHLAPHTVRDVIACFRDAVAANAEGINRLNVYPVPDGDTGTNMARTLDAVVAELADAEPTMVGTCHAISHGSLMGARGNSGVILSQILRGMAEVLRSAEEATPRTVAAALRSAATAAYAAVLRPVEGTILTVVREVAEAAEQAVGAGAGLAALLERARDAGQEALARTPELLPALKEAGVVDAGAAGFLYLLDAALHVVEGRPLPAVLAADGDAPAPIVLAHPSVADLRYEVMFFLDLVDERRQAFLEAWGEIGDSIVVVGGDGLYNCHIHTDDVGAAIEVALDHGGRPSKIRVTDLADEVDHLEAQHHGSAAAPPTLVRTAVVAVCAGGGISALLRGLGVQEVVIGGQTMNPSTAELLAAVERAPADAVVVLPNNRNIIPVANQVGAHTPKQVHVVPTRTVMQALGALVLYDPEGEPAAVAATLADAAGQVASGALTQAVRASSCDLGPIAAGDWLGLADDDGIVAVASERDKALTELLEAVVEPHHGVLTVLEGEGADAAGIELVRAWAEAARPGLEVEVHAGGQPLYPYLLGAE